MTQIDALDLLRNKCAETSQARVARDLGCSPSAINSILKGSYPNPEHILQRVIEVYGGLFVDCPELREQIPYRECAEHRRRGPVGCNSFYVRMYNACRDCTKNNAKED